MQHRKASRPVDTATPLLTLERRFGEMTPRPARGATTAARRRFAHNPLAVIGLLIMIGFALCAAFAPAIAPHDPATQTSRNSRRPPAWIRTDNPQTSGTAAHLLGTDALGRDQWSRLLFGTRVSLLVGIIPSIIATVLGVGIGCVAGLSGGRVDNLLMRFTEIVMAFPSALMLIVLSTALRATAIGEMWSGLLLIFLVLGVVSWCDLARLVRAQALQLKQQEFVIAAHTLGLPVRSIILRHVLPHVLATVLVAVSFQIAAFIPVEAGLTFLGIGLRPSIAENQPLPTSWGIMLLDGYDNFASRPWMLIPPLACITVVAIACTMVAEGLRDALDPQN